jgi:hypothetical protein
MAWTNQDLVLFHGTDLASALAILSGGVNLALCSPLTDFGRGFYTTTNRDQAINWAVLRALKLSVAGKPSAKGAVLRTSVDRIWLGGLDTLAFVREDPATGFPEFVRYCRSGGTPHKPPLNGDYQVVYGPVVQWQGLFGPTLQLFVLKDCDQVSFHDASAVDSSSPLFAMADVDWEEP